MKIKVRAISQIGSYVFIEKRRFNICDPDLFMAVAYIPHNEEEKIVYLVPATEWGISFSKKAKDAIVQNRGELNGE